MNYNKFLASKDHEHVIKSQEGKIAKFFQNERSSGKTGGWRLCAYLVKVEFVDGDVTLISYPSEDGRRRIVKTSALEVLMQPE